nr:Chain B, peptide [synthetic construct]
RWYERWV